MEKLKSRKFWFALLGAVLPILAQYFSAEIDVGSAVQMSIVILTSYIFGQAYVDGKEKEGVLPAPPPTSPE